MRAHLPRDYGERVTGEHHLSAKALTAYLRTSQTSSRSLQPSRRPISRDTLAAVCQISEIVLPDPFLLPECQSARHVHFAALEIASFFPYSIFFSPTTFSSLPDSAFYSHWVQHPHKTVRWISPWLVQGLLVTFLTTLQTVFNPRCETTQKCLFLCLA